MRWFLDMCIILYYAGEGDSDSLINRTHIFLDNKKNDSFILCYYIKDENLPRWIERQRIIYREIVRQTGQKDYQAFSARECEKLYERDKKKLRKFLAMIDISNDKKKTLMKIQNVFIHLEFEINSFLRDKIDEYVIPTDEIDPKLKSCIMTYLNLGSAIKNESDAKTIASAIQEHNKNKQRPIKILTADKKDMNNEMINEVHNDIFLKKKYVRLPGVGYV